MSRNRRTPILIAAAVCHFTQLETGMCIVIARATMGLVSASVENWQLNHFFLDLQVHFNTIELTRLFVSCEQLSSTLMQMLMH